MRDRPFEEWGSLGEVREDLMVGVGAGQLIHYGNVDRLELGFDLVDLEVSLAFVEAVPVVEALVGSWASDLEESLVFVVEDPVGSLVSDLAVSLAFVAEDLEVSGLVGSLVFVVEDLEVFGLAESSVAGGQGILAEVFDLEVSSDLVEVTLDSLVCYQPETFLASCLVHVAFLDRLVQLVSLVCCQKEMKGKVVLGYLACGDLDSYQET
jgi:hypothetical protein